MITEKGLEKTRKGELKDSRLNGDLEIKVEFLGRRCVFGKMKGMVKLSYNLKDVDTKDVLATREYNFDVITGDNIFISVPNIMYHVLVTSGKDI